MDYAILKQRLLERYPQSRLTPLPETKLKEMRDKHPTAPDDLLDFLATVGWGRIGEMRLMIYTGLIAPQDIYDATTAAKLKGVLLIGDDFSGYCVGYHTDKAWLLGEVNPSGKFVACPEAKTFSELVEKRLLR